MNPLLLIGIAAGVFVLLNKSKETEKVSKEKSLDDQLYEDMMKEGGSDEGKTADPSIAPSTPTSPIGGKEPSKKTESSPISTALATSAMCSSYYGRSTLKVPFKYGKTSVKWLNGGLIGNTVMRMIEVPGTKLFIAEETLRMLKDEAEGMRADGIFGQKLNDLEALTRCYEKWMVSKLGYYRTPDPIGPGGAPDLSKPSSESVSTDSISMGSGMSMKTGDVSYKI